MVKKLAEVRSSFLEYFKKQDHHIIDSAPLVPHDDDSLMFVNSGMVQFKNYFTGLEKPPHNRVASAQKCVRAGGKHNDLENVGYTARHHTFFEMLGNFSFGDYFKEEAIFYAWEFITKELALPKEKLLVTVYNTDTEAFDLWQKIAGLSQDKIIKIATSDNFWAMGDTGPCGPCSEIFYDHGSHIAGNPPGSGDEGDRFIEIWNLVFMQYNRLANGELTNLPNKAIDTGMGLERITAILQGKQNNFEIGLFNHLVTKSQEITGKNQPEYITSQRVIADHLRSVSFLIADGVLPSNEGRGYVLRRIMRRAMRHSYKLGYKKPLLAELFADLLDKMGGHYGELHKAKNIILETLNNEEEKFGKTLDKGLKILEEEISANKNNKILSGEILFKLYDTYGFPSDLTADIVREHNIVPDYKSFDKLMEEQKQRGKLNWQGSGAVKSDENWFLLEQKIGAVNFLGYETEELSDKIAAICDSHANNLDNISDVAQEYYVITKNTPFYAESGGQVGDQGQITTKQGVFAVRDTKKLANNLIIHIGKLKSGTIKIADEALLSVDSNRRKNIRANHSATHIIHKALKDILGQHVSQRGSYVADDILRFDFTHPKALSKAEIKQIEILANNIIQQNGAVNTEIMSIDDAKKSGAQALFGEKYDNEVRVLSMGEDAGEVFSKELCGGTHVERLGDIAMIKIISEGSIASGIRRIEAITGMACLKYMQEQEVILHHSAQSLKSAKKDICDNIDNLLKNKKDLEKQLSNLKQKLSLNISDTDIIKANDQKILFKVVEGIDAKDARDLALKFKQQNIPFVNILAVQEDKISVIIAVDKKILPNINAVDIVRDIVPILGGKGGGGKDDFAQGGGNLVANIPKARKFLIDNYL